MTGETREGSAGGSGIKTKHVAENRGDWLESTWTGGDCFAVGEFLEVVVGELVESYGWTDYHLCLSRTLHRHLIPHLYAMKWPYLGLFLRLAVDKFTDSFAVEEFSAFVRREGSNELAFGGEFPVISEELQDGRDCSGRPVIQPL